MLALAESFKEVSEAVELALIVCEVVAEAGAATRDENRNLLALALLQSPITPT